MTILLLALAGGVGAAVRSLIDVVVASSITSKWPWSTFLVNVTGSFALGLLVGSVTDDDLLLIVGTGFLGGYTTFSTAGLDAVTAALDHRRWGTLTIAGTSVVVCVAAAACGVWLG